MAADQKLGRALECARSASSDPRVLVQPAPAALLGRKGKGSGDDERDMVMVGDC